jgi:hypothetical protein
MMPTRRRRTVVNAIEVDLKAASSLPPENTMAKPNYAFEKRQREMEKKRKKQEKEERKTSSPRPPEVSQPQTEQQPK